MNEIRFLVLKGRYILAQGKRRRSVALGLGSEKENRPRDKVFQSENLISDETGDILFPENDTPQFRPKGIICFVHRIRADGFSAASFTQGGVSVRSSRNYALGYTILAFQAVKKSRPKLVYKE